MEELNEEMDTYARTGLYGLSFLLTTLASVGLIFKRFGLRIVSVDMLDQRLNSIESKVDELTDDFREDAKKYGVAIAELRRDQEHLKENVDRHERKLFPDE